MSSSCDEYRATSASGVGGDGNSLEQDSLDLPDYDVDEPRTFASSEEQQAFLHLKAIYVCKQGQGTTCSFRKQQSFRLLYLHRLLQWLALTSITWSPTTTKLPKLITVVFPETKRVTYDRGSVMAWIQRDFLMVVVLKLMTKE
jgi:hypothetical protein